MAELREARRHAEEVVQCPRRVGAATARRSRAAPDGISERSTPAIAIAPHTPGPLALPGPMTLRRAAGMR